MKNERKNHLKVKEKEEMYRSIVEYSFETTIIHSNQKVLYINDAGVDFLRANCKEDLIGANVVDVFTEEYRDFIVERIRKGEEEKRVGELMETKIYRVDGSVVDIDLFCHPVVYGDINAIQTIIRDITPRKEVERKLVEVMTPVVPISDGVAVIPLVGHVDEERCLQLFDTLPKKIKGHSFKYIIIDISGIYSIDEMVLDFLYKMNSVLNLIGVSPIFTGIRVELAHKMVNTCSNGTYMSLKTMSNVEQALKNIPNNRCT